MEIIAKICNYKLQNVCYFWIHNFYDHSEYSVHYSYFLSGIMESFDFYKNPIDFSFLEESRKDEIALEYQKLNSIDYSSRYVESENTLQNFQNAPDREEMNSGNQIQNDIVQPNENNYINKSLDEELRKAIESTGCQEYYEYDQEVQQMFENPQPFPSPTKNQIVIETDKNVQIFMQDPNNVPSSSSNGVFKPNIEKFQNVFAHQQVAFANINTLGSSTEPNTSFINEGADMPEHYDSKVVLKHSELPFKVFKNECLPFNVRNKFLRIEFCEFEKHLLSLEERCGNIRHNLPAMITYFAQKRQKLRCHDSYYNTMIRKTDAVLKKYETFLGEENIENLRQELHSIFLAEKRFRRKRK